MLNSNSEVYITPFPSMLKDLHGRRGRTILRVTGGGWHQGREHINPTETVTIHKAYRSSVQTKAQQGGEEVSLEPPPPAEKLLLSDWGWEKKVKFSPVEWHTPRVVGQTTDEMGFKV